ncbi:hypothetical protein COJ07_28845 [Bacillus cereus]|nr:hypothetical protein COJ07_28845 [Bacillus cereus]
MKLYSARSIHLPLSITCTYSMQLICRGECDMKQNKRAIFLICATAIVTSGLAILPWFII